MKLKKIDYENVSYEKLLTHIVSGYKFKYISYDHKRVMDEYNSSEEFEKVRKWFPTPNCFDIPEKLKEKYKIERVGKLREIYFAPSGRAFRFKIGNKRAKTFYISDFGK